MILYPQSTIYLMSSYPMLKYFKIKKINIITKLKRWTKKMLKCVLSLAEIQRSIANTY